MHTANNFANTFAKPFVHTIVKKQAWPNDLLGYFLEGNTMKNRVPEVFLSEMFGELRIMEDDNKFYFCAADVCSALGYSNPSHELNIHCRHDGIKAGRTDVNGVPRIIKFISEGNVYRLICRSNKPEAEKFETWVFDELLPRIRQTGGYVNDPVVFVDNWLPNTDAKTKALLVTSLEAVKNQDNIIGVQQESVEFHRAVSASVNSVDFGEFAKCLANDRISIGRNRLMAWLRKEKYIDSANVAYQRYIDQEIFEVKETVYYVGTTYQTKAGKAHGFNRGMIGRTLELLWEKFQNNFVYIHVFVTTWHLKYDIIDT